MAFEPLFGMSGGEDILDDQGIVYRQEQAHGVQMPAINDIGTHEKQRFVVFDILGTISAFTSPYTDMGLFVLHQT